jgi:23S rRNA (guanosine2251-2'-O)-methyltransferase
MGKQFRSTNERRHQHSDLDAAVRVRTEDDLHAILDELEAPPLLLILDGVQDPHNLGACLRTADAAGVQAVVVPKDRSVGLTDVVRVVACGAAEVIPLIQVTNMARCLKALKERNIWLVGTADKADQSLYEVDLTGPLGVVMGAEGQGLRRLVAEQCDFLVSLPMEGSVPCLNVSVATGVCLFEAGRQRRRP